MSKGKKKKVRKEKLAGSHVIEERNSFNISMQTNRLASDGTHVKSQQRFGGKEDEFSSPWV